MSEVFLDSSFAIALSSPSDLHHVCAVQLSEELEREGTRLITTRAILFEIGNGLSKLRHRQAAVGLLLALERDSRVEIVPVSEELYHSALDLFQRRTDKESIFDGSAVDGSCASRSRLRHPIVPPRSPQKTSCKTGRPTMLSLKLTKSTITDAPTVAQHNRRVIRSSPGLRTPRQAAIKAAMIAPK